MERELNPIIWLKQAEKVMNDDRLTAHGKDVCLAGLLDQMEYIYAIPALYNKNYAMRHPSVIAVYRMIGDMRNL